jgi:hypothetical protein
LSDQKADFFQSLELVRPRKMHALSTSTPVSHLPSATFVVRNLPDPLLQMLLGNTGELHGEDLDVLGHTVGRRYEELDLYERVMDWVSGMELC